MSTKSIKIVTVLISIALITCVAFLLIFKINVNNSYKQTNQIMQSVLVKNSKDENDVDWEKLKAKNKDVIGWLSINDTTINTPIVQSTDNSYYLKKNFNKKYSFNGNPFIDYRNDMNIDDTNTIIYGHNMRDSQLFGELLDIYKNSQTASNYKIIKLKTPKSVHKYAIIGAFYTNSEPKDDNGYVFEYNSPNLDEGDYADFLAQLEQRYIFTSGVDVNMSDKLLTLSTCAYQFKNERFVVVARELRNGESENSIKFNFEDVNNPRYPDKWYKVNHKNNIYKNLPKWSLSE